MVAYAFDLPESKVRVRNPPYLGGGFGVRIGISGKAELLAAALSMKALRPVKMVYSREEDFIASDTRHGGYMHARLGAKKDSTFLALDTAAKLNTGAYCTFGVELPAVCGVCGTAGTYHIPYMRYMGYPVYTNHQTAGAFRSFGTPHGTAVVEACVVALNRKILAGTKLYALYLPGSNYFHAVLTDMIYARILSPSRKQSSYSYCQSLHRCEKQNCCKSCI